MPHYFDQETTTASDEQSFDVALVDVAFSITTDRGVFSHGHLDNGTSLLLKEGPALPAAGTFLDLGCGAGPIAIAMALRSPQATVWAVDVNERARSLTAANAKRNHAPNIRVAAPDEALAADVQFDEIWSNPPIRIGKAPLHDLLTTWIARLVPNGRMVLVVQKHLGADSLQSWLNQQGVHADRIASRSGFRLLRVVHNERATTSSP
ncbi:MAG TPA: methyltransferase [Ilumatobacter sp.]|nr:methyltransferase [Ilumatobacter sp.]